MKLFERLLDTDAKADLLTLFHNNANLSDSLEGLARRLGHNPAEVQHEVEDLVDLGILQKTEVYSFGGERDREIQEAISKQFALGEALQAEGIEGALSQPAGIRVAGVKTDIEILDRLLPDGLPPISTVLLLSDPGAGGENILANFVKQILTGKSILYITLDNFPANVKLLVSSQLMGETLDWSKLIFVDCYSKTVGLESEEELVVDPDNLSGIGIAISNAMSKTPLSLIVLDSFNTLIRKRGVRSAIEFLRVLVARTRQAKCICFVTMNRKAFHPAIVASAEDVVDGVIELKIEETQDEIARSIRVLKMTGARHGTTWTPYKMSDEGRLEHVRPSGTGGT